MKIDFEDDRYMQIAIDFIEKHPDMDYAIDPVKFGYICLFSPEYYELINKEIARILDKPDNSARLILRYKGWTVKYTEEAALNNWDTVDITYGNETWRDVNIENLDDLTETTFEYMDHAEIIDWLIKVIDNGEFRPEVIREGWGTAEET
jgi:hypothetical protein